MQSQEIIVKRRIKQCIKENSTRNNSLQTVMFSDELCNNSASIFNFLNVLEIYLSEQ